MDKVAVNQQIVLMRKVVKHSQRMLLLSLTKQRKMLQQSVDKLSTAGEVKKAEAAKLKLKRVNAQTSAAKSVSVDIVSKEALKNVDSWQKIIQDPKSSVEQRVIAKIAIYPKVQKSVQKFRKDHTDWQLYLNTLLDLWEQKKKIHKNIPMDDSEYPRNDDLETAKTGEKLKTKKSEKVILPEISPSKQNKKSKNVEKVAKSPKKLKAFKNDKVVETKLDSDEETVEPEEQFDNFFVNKKSIFPSVAESETPANVKPTQGKKYTEREKFGKKFNDRNANGRKFNDRHTQGKKYADGKKFTQREPYAKYTHTDTNGKNKFNSSKSAGFKTAFTKGKQNFKEFKKQDDSRNQNEKLHPSWEAKKQQKQVFKIDFNNCQAKKIRFDD